MLENGTDYNFFNQHLGIFMAITLTIPDDVVESLKLPRQRIEAELKQEMAFTFYERGFASMGVARRYAELDKWAFLEGLAKRGIPRHYGEDELNEDLAYLCPR
jgi:predicted HTH domain antitoxin